MFNIQSPHFSPSQPAATQASAAQLMGPQPRALRRRPPVLPGGPRGARWAAPHWSRNPTNAPRSARDGFPKRLPPQEFAWELRHSCRKWLGTWKFLRQVSLEICSISRTIINTQSGKFGQQFLMIQETCTLHKWQPCTPCCFSAFLLFRRVRRVSALVA